VPVIDNIADMEAVYTLNETAFAVWDLIDGKKTIEKISGDITAMFEIDRKTALKDTLELMLDLESHRMISE